MIEESKISLKDHNPKAKDSLPSRDELSSQRTSETELKSERSISTSAEKEMKNHRLMKATTVQSSGVDSATASYDTWAFNLPDSRLLQKNQPGIISKEVK